MKKYLPILLLLIFSTTSYGANRGKSDLAHIKLGDTTHASYGNKKIKSKRPTVNIDSNYVTLSGWADSLGNPEVSMQISMIHDLMPFADTIAVDSINGDIRVMLGKKDYFTYECFVRGDGNFEWNAVLLQNPGNNRNFFEFDIVTEGLDFFYQDSLMDWEKAEGDIRPDSVVGSYAVYHSSRRDNWQSIDTTWTTDPPNIIIDTNFIEQYGTGKFGHFFRPKAWDANGDTVWVDMEIDTVLGKMILSLDKAWKRNATYPITIDPIFGDNGIGTTEKNIGQWVRGSKFTMNAENSSSIDSITVYSVEALGRNHGVAIYTDVSGTITALVDTSLTLKANATNDWVSHGASDGGSLSSSAVYWLVSVQENSDAFTTKHDNGGTNTGCWVDLTNFWPFEATAVIGSGSVTGSRIYSIYVTYSVSGGAPTVPQIIKIDEKKIYDDLFYADESDWDYPYKTKKANNDIDWSELHGIVYGGGATR